MCAYVCSGLKHEELEILAQLVDGVDGVVGHFLVDVPDGHHVHGVGGCIGVRCAVRWLSLYIIFHSPR